MLNLILVLSQVNNNLMYHSNQKILEWRDLLRNHSSDLTDAICPVLYNVTSKLYSNGLIPLETKDYIVTTLGISDNLKAHKLMIVIEQTAATHDNNEYLIDICNVLRNQQIPKLRDIATNILHQLSKHHNNQFSCSYYLCIIRCTYSR